MNKQVQIYSVRFEGNDAIPFVPDEQADCFAVAIGVPGGFQWVTDFPTKAQAIEYGRELAAEEGAEFRDYTVI